MAVSFRSRSLYDSIDIPYLRALFVALSLMVQVVDSLLFFCLFVFLSFLSFSLLFIGKLFLLGSVFSWGPGSFLHQPSISFVSCLSRRLCLRQVGGTLRLSEFRIQLTVSPCGFLLVFFWFSSGFLEFKTLGNLRKTPGETSGKPLENNQKP